MVYMSDTTIDTSTQYSRNKTNKRRNNLDCIINLHQSFHTFGKLTVNVCSCLLCGLAIQNCDVIYNSFSSIRNSLRVCN